MLRILLHLFIIKLLFAKTIVKRQRKCQFPLDAFCPSQDQFTNYRNESSFCCEKNATCDNGCSYCTCKEGLTFFSYKVGCVSSSTVKKELSTEDECFQSKTYDSWKVQSVGNISFTGGCRYLYVKPSQISNFVQPLFQNCAVDQAYTINPINGSKDEIAKLIWEITYPWGHQCLNCIEPCELGLFAGRLVYLTIKCVERNRALESIKTVSKCLIFQVEGTYQTNDKYISRSGTEKVSTNNYLAIFVPVIILIVMIAVVIGVLVVRRRRKSPRPKRKALRKAGAETDDATMLEELSQTACKSYDYVYIRTKDEDNRNVVGKIADKIYYKPERENVSNVTDHTAMDENSCNLNKYDTIGKFTGKSTEYDTNKQTCQPEKLNIDPFKSNEEKVVYDRVGSIISTDDYSKRNLECQSREYACVGLLNSNNERSQPPKSSPMNGYDQVGSIIPNDGYGNGYLHSMNDNNGKNNKLKLERNNRKNGYDEVGTIIPSDDA